MSNHILLSDAYLSEKRKNFATVAKLNNILHNDFIKTLLPLVKTFVSQSMQKIINSFKIKLNKQPQ